MSVIDFISKNIERLFSEDNELCSQCGKDMGFPKSLSVDDPIRNKVGNGHYDAGGQMCSECHVRIYPNVKTRFVQTSD